ncbi:urea transporter [Pseudomonas sp. SA3-5]|uniref:Urea transporter n=1 Tax=Pseudomonas aestuarii TaxID=3018340 RepID=A0ABT4XI71_9PSED|nr:urea transporter [Pseudomonas aestuarii]MDA7087899.1 urea transporter [Pseudomonas aestuarii]
MHQLSLPPRARRGLRALLNGFSQIVLLSHAGCGLLVVLAILIGAPQLLGAAVLGGGCSMLTARCRNYPQADIVAGLYGYNGILLGMLISVQFCWSPLLPLLIILGAGLSSLILAAWMRCMRERQWLPAFTLPFVALSWLLLWLAQPLQLHSAAVTAAHGLDWLAILQALLRGLGQVIFLEQPLAGLCLWLGVLLADRRAALWALLGSAAGLSLALYQGGEQHSALAGLYGYNPALAAIALHQVHRQPWAPLLGICLALLLQPGFGALGLPPLTLPFILACWLIQASQRVLRQAAVDCSPARRACELMNKRQPTAAAIKRSRRRSIR